MTKTVATEVARRNVTVNAVAPGLIATDMTEGLGDGLLTRCPRAAPERPTRSPPACASSPPSDAGYVTGRRLTVDGGLTA